MPYCNLFSAVETLLLQTDQKIEIHTFLDSAVEKPMKWIFCLDAGTRTVIGYVMVKLVRLDHPKSYRSTRIQRTKKVATITRPQIENVFQKLNFRGHSLTRPTSIKTPLPRKMQRHLMFKKSRGRW